MYNYKELTMSQIVLDHNPSEEKLKELGVTSWSTWDCSPSKFPLDFDMTETAYVLEGEFHVYPEGGEKVVVKAGDLVVFPKGLKSNWEVVKQLKKHYKHS
ncbi:MAG: putative cupin superfamily protein [Bermanella sp.]|jgi:uncharacterized cupin superfamily protein|tara:strand:+ start:2306 stop:2605 length:300 start_codon:yes stop_codon:yes gene_type:complete